MGLFTKAKRKRISPADHRTDNVLAKIDLIADQLDYAASEFDKAVNRFDNALANAQRTTTRDGVR